LAQALLQACELPVLEAQQVSLLEIGRARGMQGIVDGRSYQLGNQALLQELNIAPSPLTAQISTLEQQGNTVILLCREGQLLALFAVADQLRATSQVAIQQLQQLGVQVLMLTGDNAHTANAIATQAGIQQVRAELLPDDKLRIIEELAQQGVTGMTGDGINDAPALARAHIGLAMAAGSDTALETADVALMQNDLQKIPEFIRLSQQTARILKQNIAFALGVKFIFFALALSGHASLWMAVFADTGTSLLVVLNGLRLLKAKLN
jgi:Cd2+/Zn2+-exporting ATPase